MDTFTIGLEIPDQVVQGSGDVYVVYYLVIWIFIMGISFLGFGLMCCPCGFCMAKVYAFLLVGATICLSAAEFWTMKNTADYFNINYAEGDEKADWANAEQSL